MDTEYITGAPQLERARALRREAVASISEDPSGMILCHLMEVYPDLRPQAHAILHAIVRKYETHLAQETFGRIAQQCLDLEGCEVKPGDLWSCAAQLNGPAGVRALLAMGLEPDEAISTLIDAPDAVYEPLRDHAWSQEAMFDAYTVKLENPVAIKRLLAADMMVAPFMVQHAVNSLAGESAKLLREAYQASGAMNQHAVSTRPCPALTH